MYCPVIVGKEARPIVRELMAPTPAIPAQEAEPLGWIMPVWSGTLITLCEFP